MLRSQRIGRFRLLRDTLAVWCAISFALGGSVAAADETKSPIKHVVVIFQENVSFDHYFATYPYARNPPGEPRFVAAPDTPLVNGLTPDLLAHNANAAPPFRLDRSEPLTCDMDHGYTNEQKAFDNGRADKFVEWGSSHSCNYDPPGDGLLRWEHGDRVVGVCSAFRSQR
jgi:phospholipase C